MDRLDGSRLLAVDGARLALSSLQNRSRHGCCGRSSKEDWPLRDGP